MLTLIVFTIVIIVPDASLYHVFVEYRNMIISTIGAEKASHSGADNNVGYSFATLENRSHSSSSSLLTENRADRLEYNVRYFCGTITGQDGPLRPGRYNSDINIFNRQSYSISFFWNAIPSSNLRTADFSVNSDRNQRVQTLDPGDSISISCIDLVPSGPLYSNDTGTTKFFEGVSTITVDLDPTLQAAISSSSRGTLVSPPVDGAATEPNTNILSVDAVYTVNALEVPSREIVLQLIEYSINSQDESRKLPSEIISKPLSITVPIKTNETVNPDSRVRDILAKEFSLNSTERQKLDISIRNLSLGVGALDDNHAISLQRINAYQPLPSSPSSSESPSAPISP